MLALVVSTVLTAFPGHSPLTGMQASQPVFVASVATLDAGSGSGGGGSRNADQNTHTPGQSTDSDQQQLK